MSKSSKAGSDNRANQLNPTHPAFYQSRGASPDEAPRLAEQHRPLASPHGARDASTESSQPPSNTPKKA